MSTSVVDDTSPESGMGKKSKTLPLLKYTKCCFSIKKTHFYILVRFLAVPPQFRPISSTSQPDKRVASQNRHTVEKEALTSLQSFLPPPRQNPKSQVRYTETQTLTTQISFIHLQSAFLSWLKGCESRTVNKSHLV